MKTSYAGANCVLSHLKGCTYTKRTEYYILHIKIVGKENRTFLTKLKHKQYMNSLKKPGVISGAPEG